MRHRKTRGEMDVGERRAHRGVLWSSGAQLVEN